MSPTSVAATLCAARKGYLSRFEVTAEARLCRAG